MNEIIKYMLMVYGSTTVASIICNEKYYIKKYTKAFKQSKRKLKFKELSTGPSIAMNRVDESFKTGKLLSRFCSLVPIFQVIYTVKNINDSQEKFNADFNEDIELINYEEESARKRFLSAIKQYKKLPEDISEKLKDEDYLPSEKEYRKVLDLNMERYPSAK